MSKNKNSSIKKEIFLPPIIGDWTSYTSEKNQSSISITKSIGAANKAISENNLSKLLFFHQELLQHFFEKITNQINSHIELESVGIDLLNHKVLKETHPDNIYQCKFSISELEQIDLILSNKAAKCISHRLCGGSNFIEEFTPLTSVEVKLVSVLNNIFIQLLSEKWHTIFPYIENSYETHFGNYKFQPQQSEDETIIEVCSNFKLLGHEGLELKVIYSLETIEKLLFFEDMLSSNIVDNINIDKEIIKKTTVPVKSVIGSTTLALEEIQKIEIGDVIFLENQSIDDPIQIIIDDAIKFQGIPILADERHVGVQVLSHQNYESFVKEKSKPTTGPFITSQKPNTEPRIENTEENTLDQPIEDPSTDVAPPEEQAAIEPTENSLEQTENNFDAPAPSENSENNQTESDDDFSWDDLDE